MSETNIIKTICVECNRAFFTTLLLTDKRIYTATAYCNKCRRLNPLNELVVGDEVMVKIGDEK